MLLSKSSQRLARSTSPRSGWSAAFYSSALIALLLPACSTLIQAHADDAFLTSEAAAELPDYSYAGYQFGLGEIPSARGEIIDVIDYGVVAGRWKGRLCSYAGGDKRSE